MIRDYIILAVGCFFIGVLIALATIAATLRLQIDIFSENIWVLAIPAILALILNIALVELYRKYKKK